MRTGRRVTWYVLPGLLLLFSLPLSAQTLRGTLVEDGSERAVGGAVVVLVDGSGGQAAGALTDPSGAFVLRAPAPGTYRLRAERIGYASTTSPLLELGAGEVREYRMAVSMQAVELEGLTASGRRRCELRPSEGLQTQRVWDEARKALAATALAEEAGLFRFRIVGYERELDPQGARIRSERTWSKSGSSENPFVTLSPESLASDGYARSGPSGTVYYAPDAEVLLSDPFLDTHCFRIRMEGGERAGQIGLAFEPVRRRDVADVEGVLWLDRGTAELRELEYRYTNVDPSLPRGSLGGRVEFERLPGGAWITRRWRIRMPIAAAPAVRVTQLGGWERMVLAGIKEDGGEVVEVRSAGGIRVSQLGRASLTGSVFDSTRAAPLARARVFLSGTQHSASTDARGAFRIEDLPEGEYSVSFTHPRLDSLGIDPPLYPVSLRVGQETISELALPSIAAVIAALCPDEPHESTGVLVGSVRNAGGPVPGARVSLSWTEHQVGPGGVGLTERTVRTETDARGRYRVCGLPPAATATVRATAAGRSSATSPLALGRRAVAMRDLHIGATRQAAVEDPAGAVVEILAGRSAPQLMGVVTDAAGTPIAGAQVVIPELGRGTLTQPSGAFRITGVPVGTHTVEARYIGYAPQRILAAVQSERATRLSFSLRIQPVALEGVEAVGELRRMGALAGFYQRRNRGMGVILTGEDIEKKRPARFNDILRGIPGLTLSPTPTGERPSMIGATGRIDEGGGCPIQYYLDGAPFQPAIPGTVTEIPPHQIEGVEIYRRLSEVPAEFRRLGSHCGVILIWTRER